MLLSQRIKLIVRKSNTFTSLERGVLSRSFLYLILYQRCVPLYRFFNPLRLYADIALCYSGRAVLQKPLHKGYIIVVILVYFGGVPLAEAVGADT